MLFNNKNVVAITAMMKEGRAAAPPRHIGPLLFTADCVRPITNLAFIYFLKKKVFILV